MDNSIGMVYLEEDAAVAELGLFETPPVGLTFEPRGEGFSGVIVLALVALSAAAVIAKRRAGRGAGGGK